MAKTVTISLPPPQRAWLESRRDIGGYTSTSDVVQDLIRQAQEAEQERLRREFADLVEASPGAAGAEPLGVVVQAARRTKRRHRLEDKGLLLRPVKPLTKSEVANLLAQPPAGPQSAAEASAIVERALRKVRRR